MRVAILGGGFQGCCAALELAMRGIRVTLYERNSTLLAGAASASEGKIHLGYTYAADFSLATARTLLRGALSFAPLMQHYLDADVPLAASKPFVYAVHRDSQVKVEDFARYLYVTHSLVDAAAGRDSYFGIDLTAAPQRLTQAALESRFDPAYITAAFDTPEIAIDTIAMAMSMRRRITEDPRIDVRTSRKITAVEDDGDHLRVHSTGTNSDGADNDTFISVVNALWDGRLAIDATRDVHPGRKWIHRFKHGIRFRLTDTANLPSVTIVLGPFGDLVAYGDGSYYISWYPACMTAHSEALAPPAWQVVPADPCISRIATKSFAAMGAIVPQLHSVRPQNITVRAGVIVAWGSTDIDDRASELHRRYDIGVHSYGDYHSIDPGKLTMAPHFARVCADRILSKSVP
jgi:FAD dependent oxidoreductase